MYPLAIIILVVILRRLYRDAPALVLPFSLLGIVVSTYHYLMQKTDLFSSATVCSEGSPCTTTWINWFGFVTIPFLALVAFLVITVMMLVVMTSDTVVYEAFDESDDEQISLTS